MTKPQSRYVSRGGLKLEAALDAFELDPADFVCADLGCNVGGFTDCLIQRGAQHVYAVDTAYGQLAWTLRQHEKVTVLERTNALHFDPQSIDDFQPCDLVVIDLGWTRQHKAIPVALQWLSDSPTARIITLIKPHYEAEADAMTGTKGKRKGVLSDEQADEVVQRVVSELPEVGVQVLGHIASPIRGGGKRGKTKEGNREYLALLSRTV